MTRNRFSSRTSFVLRFAVLFYVSLLFAVPCCLSFDVSDDVAAEQQQEEKEEQQEETIVLNSADTVTILSEEEKDERIENSSNHSFLLKNEAVATGMTYSDIATERTALESPSSDDPVRVVGDNKDEEQTVDTTATFDREEQTETDSNIIHQEESEENDPDQFSSSEVPIIEETGESRSDVEGEMTGSTEDDSNDDSGESEAKEVVNKEEDEKEDGPAEDASMDDTEETTSAAINDSGQPQKANVEMTGSTEDDSNDDLGESEAKEVVNKEEYEKEDGPAEDASMDDTEETTSAAINDSRQPQKANVEMTGSTEDDSNDDLGESEAKEVVNKEEYEKEDGPAEDASMDDTEETTSAAINDSRQPQKANVDDAQNESDKNQNKDDSFSEERKAAKGTPAARTVDGDNEDTIIDLDNIDTAANDPTQETLHNKEEGSQEDKTESDRASTVTTKKDDSTEGEQTTAEAKEKEEGSGESAPKGSLADFFAKAQSSSSSFENLAQQQQQINDVLYAQEQQQEPGKRLQQKQLPLQPEEKEFSGAWGVYSEHKHVPDMELLYMVFKSRVKKELGIPSDAQLREAIFPLGIGSDDDDEDDENQRPETPYLDTTNITGDDEGQQQPHSNNNDFVEGLDDIGKFFEGVDPPDELDVGASGSSIQEVLMGKGREILVKRVRLGVQIVTRLFIATKNKLMKHFSNDDGKSDHGSMDEDQDGISFQEAVIGIWRAGRKVMFKIVEFVDETIFAGGGVVENVNDDEDFIAFRKANLGQDEGGMP